MQDFIKRRLPMHMIERIARVCYRHAYPEVREDDLNFDGLPEPRHELYMTMARAAIDAMREPSEKMVLTAYEHAPLGDHDPESAWKTMIDVALQESKETEG